MALEELVNKFQQKDEKAFKTLYDMYSNSMEGVIYNIVKDRYLTEEIMQDVFVKVWEKSDTYSNKKGRFYTWILRIARNAAIDEIRSKSYKTKKLNLNSDTFVDILESKDNLERKTDAIGITEFVKDLSEKCKEIIQLIYFKGYTQSETSKALEIPIGSIKTRNRNCIQNLRNTLINYN